MSRKEIIFPGHSSKFNSKAREFERQEKHREKRLAKIKNHKNNHQNKWPLAENDKKYCVPFFKKTGEKLILESKDLAEAVIPINVVEAE